MPPPVHPTDHLDCGGITDDHFVCGAGVDRVEEEGGSREVDAGICYEQTVSGSGGGVHAREHYEQTVSGSGGGVHAREHYEQTVSGKEEGEIRMEDRYGAGANADVARCRSLDGTLSVGCSV